MHTRRLHDWNPLPAERKLAERVGTGLTAVIGDGTLPPENPPEDRKIRASFLRALILNQIPDCPVHEKGVRVAGAFVQGDGYEQDETRGLDLEGCDVPYNLALVACRFSNLLLLRSTSLRNLYLHGSSLGAGLGGDQLKVKGSVLLRGLVAQGAVRLLGAKLGADLDCNGARLTAGADGHALAADRLEATGGVFLRELVAQGAIRLLGATLGGNLDCKGARLTAEKEGSALQADDLKAHGSVFLRELVAQGEVRLVGAKLGGVVDCEGARLTAVADGNALQADELEAKGIFLRGLIAQGAVRFSGAKLGGNLVCDGARLTAGKNGKALQADDLDVKGSVLLPGLVAQGEVWLVGANVGQDLACTGMRLTADAGGTALQLQSARVAGGFLLRDGTKISGGVDLTGGEIGLFADNLASWPQRKGDLLLDRCRYGAFSGLGTPVDAASRIAWLSLQDGRRWGADFWPQPWEECARVLREMGHGAAARDILIEKEKRQRASQRARVLRDVESYGSPRFVWFWMWLWDMIIAGTVRYGRMPLLAVVWLLLPLTLGFGVFWAAQAQDAIKPNLPQIQRAPEWIDCAEGGTRAATHVSQSSCFLAQPEARAYPRFNALVYSADTLIPVVSLEMQAYWIPDDRKRYGAFARGYLWVHIALGWALSLLAVAGFSGLIKTDNTK
ncbi:hypothetical protein [Pararhodobacter sp. SW119]|uniref:hypothetical protein n=1 Tax=Pararhodobacter sp. SW119 TaxID=2780075 RepID=UPI001AE06434|nr:hypothetical protein [Pararhodobacter sp. SW119]